MSSALICGLALLLILIYSIALLLKLNAEHTVFRFIAKTNEYFSSVVLSLIYPIFLTSFTLLVNSQDLTLMVDW